MYVHILFIHSSLVGHLSLLCNVATWTAVQLTLMRRYLCDVLFWRLLGKSWEVVKLARTVGLPGWTSILILIVAGLACVPTQCSGLLESAPQQQLLLLAVLIAALLTVVRWNLNVVSLHFLSPSSLSRFWDKRPWWQQLKGARTYLALCSRSQSIPNREVNASGTWSIWSRAETSEWMLVCLRSVLYILHLAQRPAQTTVLPTFRVDFRSSVNQSKEISHRHAYRQT